MFEIYSENVAIMMSKDSTKLQSHRKEIFTRWLSSTFSVSDAQSISDSFVLCLFNYSLLTLVMLSRVTN